ncbi:HAD-IIB family hydrolase [uncultured Jatrophihabitans sp.]|uniref:HAD-IIB family hydrolase n=1 Tax=uncultured Jatrophihabitans sp. TaxID=1610747 RepID=UPI0035C9B365
MASAREPGCAPLFVSDLDFTLLRSDATLSERTTATVNRVLASGQQFTCATARSYSSTLRVTAGLELTLPLITYGGSVLYDPVAGEVTDVAALPDDTVAAVLDATARHDHVEPLLYVMLDGRDRVCWREAHANPFIDSFAARRRNNPRLMPLPDWSVIADAPVFYVTLIGERPAIDQLRVDLEPHLADCFDTVGPDGYHRDQTWFEITSADGTKAAAARRLQARLGATQLVAFGDNLNDLPLFAAADHSCAVANAVPELRAIATEVIADNDSDGVAAWLERHALI